MLVAHRNLVETRTIKIGEIRHQTRAEIRSHAVQRTSEAEWPLTDVAESELAGTRRRERAHDQNFLADAGSKTQVVQRNRGPIGGGHLLDGILNRRASLSVKCGGGNRRECGDRAEKFSSVRIWSSLRPGWAGSIAD